MLSQWRQDTSTPHGDNVDISPSPPPSHLPGDSTCSKPEAAASQTAAQPPIVVRDLAPPRPTNPPPLRPAANVVGNDVDTKEWECATCTLRNSITVLECGACGAQKGQQTSSQTVEEQRRLEEQQAMSRYLKEQGGSHGAGDSSVIAAHMQGDACAAGNDASTASTGMSTPCNTVVMPPVVAMKQPPSPPKGDSTDSPGARAMMRAGSTPPSPSGGKNPQIKNLVERSLAQLSPSSGGAKESAWPMAKEAAVSGSLGLGSLSTTTIPIPIGDGASNSQQHGMQRPASATRKKPPPPPPPKKTSLSSNSGATLFNPSHTSTPAVVGRLPPTKPTAPPPPIPGSAGPGNACNRMSWKPYGISIFPTLCVFVSRVRFD